MDDFFKDHVDLTITLMHSKGWDIVVSEEDKAKPLKSGGLGKIVRVERATHLKTEDSTENLVMKIPEKGHGDSLKEEAEFWKSEAGEKLKTHQNVVAPLTVCEVCALFPMWEDGNLEDFMSEFCRIGGPYFENAHQHVLQVVVSDLLNVLGFVTALGFQHRDVKPSNIMIKKDAESGGLSRLGVIDWSSVAPIGTKGLIGTTITFQAPEMVLGLGCSSTSDLYSACLVFVSMTVGFHNIVKPPRNEKVSAADLAVWNLCMEMHMFRVGTLEMDWVKKHMKNVNVGQVTKKFLHDHNEKMLLGWPNNKTNIVHKLHGRHMKKFMELILCSLAVIPEKRKSVEDLQKRLKTFGITNVVSLSKMKRVSLWPSDEPSVHPSKRHFSIAESFAGAALCAMLWRKYPRKDTDFFWSLFEKWGRTTVASRVARLLWSGNPNNEPWPEIPPLMDINPSVVLHSEPAFRAVANWAELSFTEMPDANLERNKLTLFCHDDTQFIFNDVCGKWSD